MPGLTGEVMDKYRVLIAEDDGDIVELLILYLSNAGYDVTAARNGREAVDIIGKGDKNFDMVILDIMMPELNGYEVAMEIRKNHNVPIMFLSAKNQDIDKIMGLDIGADDYLTKPFNPMEVVARVRSNIRRYREMTPADAPSADSAILKCRDLVLDTEKMMLTKSGEPVQITVMEFRILQLLMKNPGKIMTKKQIYHAMYGDEAFTDDNSLTVHISKIRAKLDDSTLEPLYIKNVRGLGYKIEK